MSTSSGHQNHRPENRLAQETSPYLLQHAHNPVDWRPWGPEALAAAKTADKPILLSVGYAACHWCHVMAHESFEDDATAAVMNDLFVNIKVDREERPDIDQIYMNALHHLGEQGGWPLTMFLTPEGEPFWGGTYFPKEARYGRVAFVDLLHEIARLFREDRATIDKNRSALMTRLKAATKTESDVSLGREQLDQAARQLANAIDPVNGGLRGAPKFPQGAMFEFLWRAGLRNNDARAFDRVTLSLDHICEGGIYDHLGGGFSRYSVDAKWLVPHFEKMLYDNAQLLELLALGWQHNGSALYRTRARETVGWLMREMVTEEGAFSASLDADSEGEEGKFYVWSLDEIMRVLGEDDGRFFAAAYDVTEAGNFEGHTILNRLHRLAPDGAASPPPDAEDRLAPMREKLLAVRAQRVRPGLDDKILADWNGLMIAALARASMIFDEPTWIDAARRAFTFIATKMTRGDRLGHSWRAGKLLFPGLASDFALMIRAALALHEATGEGAYLTQAENWQAALMRHYANAETGGHYLTADDAEGLVVRPSLTTDDALPNHDGITAQNLTRLAMLTGDAAWRAKADALFDGLLPIAATNLYGHVSLLNALDVRLHGAEIVVTGADDGTLTRAALAVPYLVRTVLRVPSATALAPDHPARAKAESLSTPAVFICAGATCSLPVTTPDAIAATIAQTLHPAAS